MILNDQVQILTPQTEEDPYSDPPTQVPRWDLPPASITTVRAAVTSRSVALRVVTGAGFTLDEQLVALIEPIPGIELAHDTHRIRWRGRDYAIDGRPLVRRRNGADHHWTIPLVDTV